MAGLTPLWNKAQISRVFDQFGSRMEDKMLKILQRAGEVFVREARERGAYTDVTGNLRSSIGYVIAQDGVILEGDFQVAGKGSDGDTGVKEARRLSTELALTHDKGLVLIGLAGMDYAVHVENIKGKDVISSAEQIAKKMVKDLAKKTFNG